MNPDTPDDVTAATLAAAIAALEAAKRDVSSAESVLAMALSQILVAPRAEKTAVSVAIEDALGRLRAARTNVDDVERALAGEKDNP